MMKKKTNQLLKTISMIKIYNNLHKNHCNQKKRIPLVKAQIKKMNYKVKNLKNSKKTN